jgi:hypothetical protein
MSPVFRRIWMTVLMAVVLLFSLMYLSYDLTKVMTIVRMGDMWSLVDLKPDLPGRLVEIDPKDYVAGPMPQVGDTLLTIGGLPATQENYFTVFTTDTPAGLRIPITFKHEGQVFATEVVTRAIPGILKAQFVTLYALRFLLTLGLILVGFWAFTHRGESMAVRTLARFCYSMAVGMLLGVQSAPNAYARFEIPFAGQLLPIAMVYGQLAAPYWVKLQLLFPVPRSWYVKRKRLVDALLFAPALLLPATMLLKLPLPDILMPVFIFLYLLGGYQLLWMSYLKTKELLLRRQVRLVLLGASPILVVATVNLVIVILAPRLSSLTQLYLLNVFCLAVLAAPVTFAYAFGRYRLLDVEGRLRRGTRFAVINVFLLLVFGGILYAFGTLLLKYLAIESRTPTLALGLVLALSFAPAQRGLRGFLESRFYPERQRLRALLQEFLESAGRTLDPSRFWQELTSRLAAGLRAEPVHAFLRTRGGIACSPAVATTDGRLPAHARGNLYRARGGRRPMHGATRRLLGQARRARVSRLARRVSGERTALSLG